MLRIIVALVLVALTSFGQVYRSDHPRLPGPHDPGYTSRLLADSTRLDSIVASANTLDPTAYGVQLTQYRNALIVCSVVTDPAHPHYASVPGLRTKITRIAKDHQFPGASLETRCYVLAMAYDWIYDQLNAVDRRLILDRLEDAVETWRHQYENVVYASVLNSRAYSNFGAGIWWAAIAAYPDRPSVLANWQWAGDLLFNKMRRVWEHMFRGGGAWHEGLEYFGVTVAPMIVQAIEACSYALQADYWALWDWTTEPCRWMHYAVRPDGTQVRHHDVAVFSHPQLGQYGGTIEAGWGGMKCYPGLAIIANRLNRPHAGVYMGRLGIVPQDQISAYPWGPLMPAPGSFTTAPESTLPLVHHAKGAGTVFIRSDWTEDATYVTVRGGNNFWSHGAFDAGHVDLFRRGSLLARSGEYALDYTSGHYRQYGSQTIAHNAVLLRGYDHPTGIPHPKPLRKTGTGSQNEAVAYHLPDGGQKRVGSWYSSTPATFEDWELEFDAYHYADITRVDSLSLGATAVLIDTTPAYNSWGTPGGHDQRTDRALMSLRSVVFIPPDCLVVMDAQVVTREEISQTVLWHTINKPISRGDGWWEILRDDVVTHVPDSWPTYLAYRNPLAPKEYQYDGKCFLLPYAGTVTTRIGGLNQEYLIDGVQWDWWGHNSQRIPPNPLNGPFEPCSWRLETVQQPAGLSRVQINVAQAHEADVVNPWTTTVNDATASVTVERASETFTVQFMPDGRAVLTVQ